MDEFEKVEVLREKANVSYEEAREAIKQADGDLLEAMVILEKQGKVKTAAQTASATQTTAQSVYRTAPEAGTQNVNVETAAKAKNPEDGFFNKVGKAMDKGIRYLAENYVLVTRKEETVIKIPIWIGILALIALWGLLPIVIIISLVCECKYQIVGEDTPVVENKVETPVVDPVQEITTSVE
jgi:hypothetical protein